MSREGRASSQTSPMSRPFGLARSRGRLDLGQFAATLRDCFRTDCWAWAAWAGLLCGPGRSAREVRDCTPTDARFFFMSRQPSETIALLGVTATESPSCRHTPITPQLRPRSGLEQQQTCEKGWLSQGDSRKIRPVHQAHAPSVLLVAAGIIHVSEGSLDEIPQNRLQSSSV